MVTLNRLNDQIVMNESPIDIHTIDCNALVFKSLFPYLNLFDHSDRIWKVRDAS